jgi:hypothetical protein
VLVAPIRDESSALADELLFMGQQPCCWRSGSWATAALLAILFMGQQPLLAIRFMGQQPSLLAIRLNLDGDKPPKSGASSAPSEDGG